MGLLSWLSVMENNQKNRLLCFITEEFSRDLFLESRDFFVLLIYIFHYLLKWFKSPSRLRILMKEIVIYRRKAIEIHGSTCIACGFDFEKTYGTHGKGFIEVHHIKPLSTYDGKEVNVDPYKDLVPLCANCHRMVHRNKDEVLTIEELKEIIESNRKRK